MANDGEDRRNPLEHDILVARRHPGGRQYFKIDGEREKNPDGSAGLRALYTKIEERHSRQSGFRAVVGLACLETQAQHGASAEEPRGPAIATLPLHPDPTASASCTCYLINPENLTYETAWTTEEWSDQEVQPSDRAIATDGVFELLIASSAGKVYLVSKRNPPASLPSVREIDVALEPELWNTLRKGTVAGSVRIVSDDTPRVVPIVNVQALMPSILA